MGQARNGQAMNMRGLQLLCLEPPMILSWVAIRQVTLLMKKVYSLFSRKPPKEADPGTYRQPSLSDDLFSKQHLTRCDEVYWCFADG